MTSLHGSKTPDSDGGSPLLSPSSAHPVLDMGTQSFVDRQAELNDTALHELSPDIARAVFLKLQSGDRPEFAVSSEDLVLPVGPSGAVKVRIVRPASIVALPIVMYFHGGGWVMGDCDTHDRVLRELAVRANVAVVCVDYTRAPEARFPTQNEEAYAAMMYVVNNASALVLDPQALALVGDCAGGNMVAAVAILARQRRGPDIALQVMFYPILSAHSTGDSHVAPSGGSWMTQAAVATAISAQFSAESQSDAIALPLRANWASLEGLPSALIITAENDVVRDDGEQYAKKLMQAGVDVTAVRYLGTIHDFVVLNDLMFTPSSRAAMSQACALLRAELHGEL